MELFPGFEMGAPRLFLFFLAIAWSSVWKGIALWRAGRNANLVWFIVLLVVNTLGILEIIYIFGFSKKKPAATSPPAPQNP